MVVKSCWMMLIVQLQPCVCELGRGEREGEMAGGVMEERVEE